MKKSDQNCGEGRLPSLAPLANPYVPFQMENASKYEPRKALVRGTLFAGLDLPFMGMVNKHEKNITPMTELQTLAFAIQELALYLDTHRDDAEAFELYCTLQKLYNDAKKEYEMNCGPMTHFSNVAQPEYKWLNDPWRWEYAMNREA